MQVYLEIRDRGTCIPAIAVVIVGSHPVARRAGYSSQWPGLLLVRLTDCEAHADPCDWPASRGRTMRVAHEYLRNGFDQSGVEWLANQRLVDVRVILGEAAEPATPECV